MRGQPTKQLTVRAPLKLVDRIRKFENFRMTTRAQALRDLIVMGLKQGEKQMAKEAKRQ